MARGEGMTTKQMESAPKGAVFVWCDGHMDYAIQLARQIGREDLQIKRPSWLEDSWRGLEFTGIVVDHAATLTDRQWDGYRMMMNRITSRAA